MEKIILYKVIDGSIFNTEEDALRYEILLKSCESINSNLKNYDKILNNNEYIQQDVNNVKYLFTQFMNIISTIIPSSFKSWAIECAENKRHISHIRKILDDCTKYKCIDILLHRFLCIDFSSGKEFSQPYYVTHQDEEDFIKVI